MQLECWNNTQIYAIINQLLRAAWANWACVTIPSTTLGFYGGLLFLMMRFAPEGLAGIARAIGAKRRSVRAPPADGPKREGAKA